MLSAIEPIVAKGMTVELDKRYRTAAEMERELVKAVSPASTSEVAAWVRSLGKEFIEGRDKIIAAEEQSWRRTHANIATMPGNRRVVTPLPGSVRRPLTLDGHTPMGTSPSQVNRVGGGKAIIGVLGALVVLLGIGVVFAMQSGGDKREPAAKPADPPPAATAQEPAAAPTPPPAPPVEKKAVEPPPPAPPQPEPAPVVATPEPTPPPVAERPAVEEKKPVQREVTVKRPANKPAARPVAKQQPKKEEPPPKPVVPEVKPAVVEPPPKKEEKRDDCNPPYYFDGPKKVFKPNCL
jgi:hypothetical protein